MLSFLSSNLHSHYVHQSRLCVHWLSCLVVVFQWKENFLLRYGVSTRTCAVVWEHASPPEIAEERLQLKCFGIQITIWLHPYTPTTCSCVNGLSCAWPHNESGLCKRVWSRRVPAPGVSLLNYVLLPLPSQATADRVIFRAIMATFLHLTSQRSWTREAISTTVEPLYSGHSVKQPPHYYSHLLRL